MKIFDKNSLWITISNIIKLAFGLLIVPVISRNVNPIELGKLDLLMAYGPFINQFISMGLTNSGTKFFKEYGLFAIIRYMQHKIFMRSILFVGAFLIYFIIYGAASIDLAILIVVLYLFSVFLENVTLLSQNQFLNENQFRRYSVVSTIHTIIRQSISLVLVLIMDNKLLALSLGLVISNCYLLTINLIFHKGLILSNYVKSELSQEIKSQIISYSRPLFLLGIVGLLYQASDKLLVAHFNTGDTSQIGYLGMAQRIIGLVTIGLSGLFTVWGIKSFENYGDDVLIKEKEKLIAMMLGVLVCILLGMFLFKGLIVRFLLTEQYSKSFPISVLLIGTFVNNRIREILEKFFLRKGQTKLISNIFMVFGIISISISGLLLYMFNLEVMLMFRLLIALFHALVLCFFLRKSLQIINPLLMGANIILSVFVILIMRHGWL